MRTKYLYVAVMLVVLAAWFAENPKPIKTQPAPAPTPAQLSTTAMPGFDIGEAKVGGQCNLEFINQTAFGADAHSAVKSAPLILTGWALDDRNVRLPKSVIVHLVGKKQTEFFAVAQGGLSRADVKEYLKVPDALLMSGFQALINTQEIPVDEYRLTLILRFDGESFICDNGRRIHLH